MSRICAAFRVREMIGLRKRAGRSRDNDTAAEAIHWRFDDHSDKIQACQQQHGRSVNPAQHERKASYVPALNLPQYEITLATTSGIILI